MQLTSSGERAVDRPYNGRSWDRVEIRQEVLGRNDIGHDSGVVAKKERPGGRERGEGDGEEFTHLETLAE